jgi:hypothetical protein
MLATYLSYVRAWDLSIKPQHLKTRRLSFAEVQTLCRYSLGWHDLQTYRGRYGGTAREQWGCKVCSRPQQAAQPQTGPVEDLVHFLLECSSQQHVRDRYPQLFLPQYTSDTDAAVHALSIMPTRNR